MAAGGGAHQRERHQFLRRHTVHIVLRDPEIRREEVTQHQRERERERERDLFFWAVLLVIPVCVCALPVFVCIKNH